ncbi:hypothetical protein LCGC14_0505120, partial [marine sediment metagenome]
DNIDTIVGTNPVGAVFSEYALQDPRAWDFIRPIMRENGGWSIFNFTPRGRNHGYKMANMAQRNERWFYEKLTVDKTLKDDGTRYITEKDIEEERADGNLETMIEQAQKAKAKVLLIGNRIPQNYGKRYTDMFFTLYENIANKYNVAYLPFMLENVALDKALMQDDGLHPNKEGQPLILQNIWPYLQPLLDDK